MQYRLQGRNASLAYGQIQARSLAAHPYLKTVPCRTRAVRSPANAGMARRTGESLAIGMPKPAAHVGSTVDLFASCLNLNRWCV